MNKYLHNVATLAKLTAVSSALIEISNQFIIYQSSFSKKLSRVPYKKYYKSQSCNLFYTIKGNGSPVLLIHDLNACGSGYEWCKIEKELSKYHTVYTIDLPGCGRSEKRKMIYTNYFLTGIVNEFIRDVIHEKTDIIANGYSCFLPFTLSSDNKSLIRKIIIVNPCDMGKYSHIPTSKENLFYKILQLPIYGTLIYHMVVSHSNIENSFIENYYYNPFHLDIDLEDVYYEASHKNHSLSKYLYSSLIKNSTGCNIGRYVKSNTNAVLLIMGEEEPNNKKIINQYRKLHSNMNVKIIDRSKHFPHFETAESFLNSILDFINF